MNHREAETPAERAVESSARIEPVVGTLWKRLRHCVVERVVRVVSTDSIWCCVMRVDDASLRMSRVNVGSFDPEGRRTSQYVPATAEDIRRIGLDVPAYLTSAQEKHSP